MAVRVWGLTGGMAMGKTTATAAFRRAGVPVFDADAAVRRLQGPGGAAVPPIARAFPDCVRDGAVDRPALRARATVDRAALRRLERILHPLVRAAERRFLGAARRAGRRLVVLDIPLLFETGGQRRVDRVVVVTAPPATQRARLQRRGTLSPQQAAALLARQCPDARRRRRADHLLRTGLGHRRALRDLRALLRGGRP